MDQEPPSLSFFVFPTITTLSSWCCCTFLQLPVSTSVFWAKKHQVLLKGEISSSFCSLLFLPAREERSALTIEVLLSWSCQSIHSPNLGSQKCSPRCIEIKLDICCWASLLGMKTQMGEGRINWQNFFAITRDPSYLQKDQISKKIVLFLFKNRGTNSHCPSHWTGEDRDQVGFWWIQRLGHWRNRNGTKCSWF